MRKSRPILVTMMLLMFPFFGNLSAQELRNFKSEEARFSILMPGEPKVSEIKVGNSSNEPTIQKQYVVGGKLGVYLVSYQDNPNLEGADSDKIAYAFDVGREGLKNAFRGEALDERAITLAEKYPGREFRMSIPAAGGEGRCRLFLVGTRLYQVMAVGVPEFVSSAETQTILNSFALVHPK